MMSNSHKILYVDDEADNLLAFKAVFRRSYDIDTAENGADALKMMQAHDYALVISDQRMPSMTGVELLERIRKQYPDAIRMVMTGYTDLEATIEAINKGNIYYYITKPWNADELRLIIDNALETYQLRWKNRELEAENLRAQFEILKNQINPHFLFNSMNVLHALIAINPEKAALFTQKFARLYRNVLQIKDQLIISLEEELDFVRGYIDLQKLRFDKGFSCEIDTDETHLQMCLPPFCIQLLVENAIKHNVVSEHKPLRITISSADRALTVSNNVQPRDSTSESTGTGLHNIRERYKLLQAPPVQYDHTNTAFTVQLPLISNT